MNNADLSGSLRDKNVFRNEHSSLLEKLIDLSAVSAQILLQAEKEEDIEIALLENMELIAKALSFDAIQIWRNFQDEEDAYFELVYGWFSEVANEKIGITKGFRLPHKGTAVFDAVLQNISVVGPVSELSKEYRKDLEGIMTTAILPLFQENVCWGYFSVHDCQTERCFIDAEITALNSISMMMVSEVSRHEMIQNLQYQGDLLHVVNSVNNAAALLLSSDVEKFEEHLEESMKNIGESLDVDCIYLWKNHIVDGQLYCSQLFEWYFEDTVFTDGKLFRYEDVVPSWEQVLASGNYINDLVRNLSQEEQDHLTPVGVLAVLVMPVFLNDGFWGFVGYDYCNKERIFTKEEVSILKSASLLIANAFILHDMIIDIRDTSTKLGVALEEAARASEAKGNFLANMSHEMRTPLNAIIGMTTIGKKANSIEKKDDALEKINDASSHLLGVINDVLDMAKIEADKLELSPIDFSFENMLQKSINVNTFRASEKRQEVKVAIDKNIPRYLHGDNLRLIQVMTNLLSNAIKFTPEGGKIEVDAKLLKEKDNTCKIQILVKDNGIGISKEQQSKLFNSFEQADSGVSRQYGGTGLGLAISKRIVELMDGEMWIESDVGKGSTFVFNFAAQVVKGGVGNQDNDLESEEQRIKADGEFSNKKILIAEDVEINREIIMALLEHTGIEIDCAENGEMAVEMMVANYDKYDIVFMDIQMPKMDGLEATRRIRGKPIEQLKKVPIIAMTANVFKDDVEACLDAGMNDHLGKPLDIDKVIETLRNYLRKQ